ncbi:hypothetical protein ACPD8N_06675 [Lacticaseibacillus chiayiensis]|uniref:hypothetical protein n=1 Tax=Lacticaseibacillus chiayiensis TaxID=2100821 RepID=UPI003C70BC6A
MAKVTQRIKQIKQPRGGYINPKVMQAREYDDGRSLSDKENLAATTMGLVVDYMTRFMLNHDVLEAFDIPIRGARIFGRENDVMQQLNLIKGLDDVSIKAAARIILVFDASYRIPELA